MSQRLSLTTESPSQPGSESLKPRMAFMMAMKELSTAGERISNFQEIKKLLSIAGFRQNGRNRIQHLSSGEMRLLCRTCPTEEELWHFYMLELQVLLSKMDQARNFDLSLGRPYLIPEIVSTVCKLAGLKYIAESGVASLQTSKVRELLLHDGWCESLAQMTDLGQSVNQLASDSINIQSAIQLMEFYRDELIMPPRFRTRNNFDEISLHNIETENFSWMDDGGKSYLEAIRDIPLTTQYDELPNFESVLDWFIATKPILDKNQIKRGWNWLEKTCDDWHHFEEFDDYSEEQINEYPSWHCAVTDRHKEWLSVIPHNIVYKLIPLTTPHQLLEESKSMSHCVVTYINDCISGSVRIFSVRSCTSNERIATAELSNYYGSWEVVQLKGKHNKDLLERLDNSNDPLTIILDILAKWYNAMAEVRH